jgi:hypothetical protein
MKNSDKIQKLHFAGKLYEGKDCTICDGGGRLRMVGAAVEDVIDEFLKKDVEIEITVAIKEISK